MLHRVYREWYGISRLCFLARWSLWLNLSFCVALIPGIFIVPKPTISFHPYPNHWVEFTKLHRNISWMLRFQSVSMKNFRCQGNQKDDFKTYLSLNQLFQPNKTRYKELVSSFSFKNNYLKNIFWFENKLAQNDFVWPLINNNYIWTGDSCSMI